jgi:hypothetical protein
LYQKKHSKYPLSMEQGTQAVPDDENFHVIVNGEIILSTSVFEYAKIIYEEKREEIRVSRGDPDPLEVIRAEEAGRNMRAMRREAVADRARRNRGGGPGGPGGVG